MHLCPGPGKAHECKEDLNWQQRILPMASKDWTGLTVMSQPCNPGCFTSTRMAELGDLCYRSTSSKLPRILLGTQYILISKMLLERGELDCSCQISIYHLQLSLCLFNTSESLPAPPKQKSVFYWLILSHHYWDAGYSSRDVSTAV